METIYPQHLDHNSEDFLKIKKELMDILNANHKGATISVDANDSTRLNVTFTLDVNEIYFYLQADGVFDKWEYVNGNPTNPRYSLTNYRIIRHGFSPDDNISALLEYIFSSEESIAQKFKEYMRTAVNEFRTERVDSLKMGLSGLLYGQRGAWW